MRRRIRAHAQDQRRRWSGSLATGFSIALAGGGIRRGYGSETDPEASAEPGKAVSVADVHATLLHALGIDTFKESMTPSAAP